MDNNIHIFIRWIVNKNYHVDSDPATASGADPTKVSACIQQAKAEADARNRTGQSPTGQHCEYQIVVHTVSKRIAFDSVEATKIDLAADLIEKIMNLPDEQLTKITKAMVSNDRVMVKILTAKNDLENNRKEARSNLCSDLHDR